MRMSVLRTAGLVIGLATVAGQARANFVEATGELTFDFTVAWSQQIDFDGGSSFDQFDLGTFPDTPKLLEEVQQQNNFGGGSSLATDSLEVNGSPVDNDVFQLSQGSSPPINGSYTSSVSATSPVPGSPSQGLFQLVEETSIFFLNFEDDQNIELTWAYDVGYDLVTEPLGGAFAEFGVVYELYDDNGRRDAALLFEDGRGASDGTSFEDMSDDSGALTFANLASGFYELRITTVSSATALSQVPLPAGLPLFLTGLAAAGWAVRRRARAAAG